MLRAQFWRTLGISALEETPADEPEPEEPEPEPDEPEPPPVFTQTRAEPFLVQTKSVFVALLWTTIPFFGHFPPGLAVAASAEAASATTRVDTTTTVVARRDARIRPPLDLIKI
jgi:hypothetical protein